MGNIYDKNQKSLHGPFGRSQEQQGPYGGKNDDNLSSKAAEKVFSPTHEIKARPKQ